MSSNFNTLSVEDRVKDIVAAQTGVGKKNLTSDIKFAEDLNADSLDIVEMAIEFEDEFEINIPDEDAQKILTIGQAIAYITEKIQK